MRGPLKAPCTSAPSALGSYVSARGLVNNLTCSAFAQSDVFLPGSPADAVHGHFEGPGSGPCAASNARLTLANASSARSMIASSCVAITLVRSSAPPGGTAGCTATLVKTPASHSARQSRAACQSSPTRTGTIGVMIDSRSPAALVTGDGSTTSQPSAGRPRVRWRGCVGEDPGHQLATVVRADHAQRRKRRTDGRRHTGGGEQEGPTLDLQEL